MRSLNDDNLPFCDEVSVEKLKQRLTSLAPKLNERITFLMLSGAFNPVHTHHVRMLEITKTHIEALGWTVIAGFLAPSSEAYVNEKLGPDALSVSQRINLCKLAIKDSNWINVCSKGELSSNWVRRSILKELYDHFGNIINRHRLTGVEIMGSDTAIRLFTKILSQNRNKSSKQTQLGRMIVYFLRSGLDHSEQLKRLEALESDAAKIGVKFIRVDPTVQHPAMESVSSNAIRELISKGDWRALKSKGWLHPSVLKALQDWNL